MYFLLIRNLENKYFQKSSCFFSFQIKIITTLGTLDFTLIYTGFLFQFSIPFFIFCHPDDIRNKCQELIPATEISFKTQEASGQYLYTHQLWSDLRSSFQLPFLSSEQLDLIRISRENNLKGSVWLYDRLVFNMWGENFKVGL